MKVIVTGAGGQLGRALVASAPKDVACLGLDRAALDIADRAAVDRVIAAERPDLVFNAAAWTAVDLAESAPEAALAVNAGGVAALAGALAGVGGRLVHVSSDFVFDGARARPWRPDDPREPLSAYGRGKALGEDAAGGDALIVRTSWVHAAGGANFVRTMLRLMRGQPGVRVVADQVGAPTWAGGLAGTLWALALKDAKGVFHHTDAGVASWYDFAVAIQEEALAIGLLDRAVPVVPIATPDFPTAAVRPAFSVLDCSATRALLGDAPVHWRVNLRRMLAGEKALGEKALG